jgi:hypothetical protein
MRKKKFPHCVSLQLVPKRETLVETHSEKLEKKKLWMNNILCYIDKWKLKINSQIFQHHQMLQHLKIATYNLVFIIHNL